MNSWKEPFIFRSSCMCTRCRSTHKLNKRPKGAYIKFVSASAPCTHAWTHEKNRLILIILQCNTQHKNIFFHIPGLKITQINIPRNLVDDVGTLTTWRHKNTSLKRKDQTSLCFVYASILNNYIISVFHWNVTIWLVMKRSHDYKRDVSHPNETQIRTCTCLHDDVRCK